MKRCCGCLLPACLKPKSSSRRGLKLSWLIIIQAIGLPLALVAADIVTDGKLIFDMYSSVSDGVAGLFYASCVILSFSMFNLIFGNPTKTLIRNVRTSVLMASREMESKDVPLPIGEYFYKSINSKLKLNEATFKICIKIPLLAPQQ